MLWNLLVTFINFLIKSLGYLLNVVLNFLPDSPFRHISNLPVADYITGLAWFIPISSILSILQLWLVAISVFYVVSALLRWTKAVG